MKFTFTKAELYESIPLSITRLSPHVITEIDKPENERLFNQILPKFEPYVILQHIVSPRGLYNFIKSHKDDFIIITDDVFDKRKNYLDVLEGAICSSPDSCAVWPVRYRNEPEFDFYGKMILCTKKTKQAIKSDKRFEYFGRDCLFV